MNELRLSSSEESKYILTGAINMLMSNKRARTLLKVKLSFTQEEERLIIDSDESIERVAQLLSLAAKYIDAKIVYDSNVASDIKEFRIKEQEFEEFGNKAKNIKENNCDAKDFKAFEISLIDNMRERELYLLQLLLLLLSFIQH